MGTTTLNGGNLALPLAEDVLQFGYGKLLLFQQQQQPDAGRIGREAQGFED